MKRQLKNILTGIHPIHAQGNLDVSVNEIVFDSRQAKLGNVFVAIEGFANDGHDYIASVIENGCEIIVSQKIVSVPEHVTLLVVEDTSEALGIMVGREHPLYDSTLRLTPDDIAQLDFALLAPDYITRLSVDEYFRQHGITPKVAIEVNSVSTLLEVVRHSPIATMLPEAIATEDRALRRLRVESEAPQRGAALLRRRNNYHSAAAVAFVELVLSMGSPSP